MSGRNPVVLLIALTALVFARAITLKYVSWDDNVMVLENAILKLPFMDALKASFTGFYHGDYIPLLLMSFWADIKLFGYNPQMQHSLNLLLHLLNVWLLFRTLLSLGLPRGQTLFVCAVFAVHPVQAESVLWICERKGLLSTALLLSAILCSERAVAVSSRRIGWNLVYALAYATAFIAKATGVLLPVFLVWVDRSRHRLSWRETLTKHLPILAIGALATYWRVIAYQESIPTLMQAAWNTDRLFKLPLIMASALGFYARLMVFPANLSIIYPTYGNGVGWGLSAALALALAALIFWGSRKTKDPWVGGFALFALLMLLPVLQIVPRINFVNDRYLYLPLVGFAAIVARLGDRFLRTAKLKWPFLSSQILWAVLLLPLSLVSLARGQVWSSDMNLWADTVAKNPENGLAHNNYAQALAGENRIDAAVAEYELNLRYGQSDATDNLGYNNLGIIFSNPQYKEYFSPPRAAEYLKRGIAAATRPEDSYTLRLNLAYVFVQMNDRISALTTLRELRAMLVASRNQRYAFLMEKIDQATRVLEGR